MNVTKEQDQKIEQRFREIEVETENKIMGEETILRTFSETARGWELLVNSLITTLTTQKG